MLIARNLTTIYKEVIRCKYDHREAKGDLVHATKGSLT